MALSTEMSVDPINISIAALQCHRIRRAVMDLEDEGKDMIIEKESLRQFSGRAMEINDVLHAHMAARADSSTKSAASRSALQNLNSQLKGACEVIEKCKSGSRLWLLLNFKRLLKQMEQFTKEISETVPMLCVDNHDAAQSLKFKIEQLASNLQSLRFRPVERTEAIMLEIEKLMAQNGRKREHNKKLLQKIMEAIGAATNNLIVREELVQLRREKEEIESRQQQDEARELSQLIGLLSSLEMVSNAGEGSTSSVRNSNGKGLRQDELITSDAHGQATFTSSIQLQNLISSFKCLLSGEVMEDPVAISCGHSFERHAIQMHFARGGRTCPVCKEELSSLELTPNISLRGTIQEWKQHNMEAKLQRAVNDIASDDIDKVGQALEDLKHLMGVSHYRDAVTEEGLVPKIVKTLEASSSVNAKAALKCLCYLTHHSKDNKKAVVEAGAICYIQNLFRRREAQSDAIAVLVELSEEEEIAEEIGNTNDCIIYLVSLLQSHNQDIAQKAEKVMENLSFNTHFVIKMAEAGYFQPFVTRFSQGPLETQAWMATALVKMHISEVKVKVFEQKQFVGALVRVLSSSSPAHRSACLHCIKKLSAYPTTAKWFLEEATTIPALLALISFLSSDPQWCHVATEILTALVEPTQLPDFEANPNLQELQSHHNIGVFLHFVTSEASTPETKTHFLCLLLAIGNKSTAARDQIRSDKYVITHLFSLLHSNHPEVIRQTLKLIYCIAEDRLGCVPLPPLPAKQMAINALLIILTSSPEVEDGSIAAGIISRLPLEDTTVDNILFQSKALKAIREVICNVESLHFASVSDESLLENALAALSRYAEPTKPKLRKQLNDLKLIPPLVQLLSNGSSRAKRSAAIVLAHLSQPTVALAADTSIRADKRKAMFLSLARLLPISSSCCNLASASRLSTCSVHGYACFSRHTLCLVKADAVKPLVRSLSDIEVAEAALQALETLFKDQSTISCAASMIVESQGAVAILDVLERGSLQVKEKALDLFQKICQHTDIQQQFRQSERILIQLLQEEPLKKKAALVLSQMDVISKQSSFF